MLVSEDSNAFVQDGWEEMSGGQRMDFGGWADTDAGVPYQQVNEPAEPINDQTYYNVLKSYTPGNFTFIADNVTQATSWQYNVPFTTEPAFTVYQGQIFGEIHTLADQMPGGVDNPESFANSHILVTPSGGSAAWVAYNGNPGDSNTSYFNIAKYSSTLLQIDDKACTY